MRLKLKKQLVWKVHSRLGLVAGLGLLVIGFSGSLLVFSTEIDRLLRPEVVKTSPDGRSRLSLDQLYDTASKVSAKHDVIGWERFADDPEATDRVWLKAHGNEHWVAFRLDPYTGEILSDPAEATENLVGWLLELHYTFLADHVGMFLAGAFAVLLCLLGLSGLCLYRDFWKNFFRLRWGRSARIYFSDLHKMIGITFVAFNLILGFTGAWWNLSHLLGHLGEEPSEENAAAAPPPRVEWASLDDMLKSAPRQIDGFTARYIALSASEEPTVTLYGHHGEAGPLRGIYGSTVTFDGLSGEVVDHFDIRAASAWQQIYDSFLPLHYGTFGGWPIKAFWCLGGLAPGALGVTGFLVWKSRRSKAIARKIT